jgi:hypothetical protein
MPFQSSLACDTVGGIKIPCRLIFLLKLSSFLFLILKFLQQNLENEKVVTFFLCISLLTIL